MICCHDNEYLVLPRNCAQPTETVVQVSSTVGSPFHLCYQETVRSPQKLWCKYRALLARRFICAEMLVVLIASSQLCSHVRNFLPGRETENSRFIQHNFGHSDIGRVSWFVHEYLACAENSLHGVMVDIQDISLDNSSGAPFCNIGGVGNLVVGSSSPHERMSKSHLITRISVYSDNGSLSA
jgi:hypothetical protein